MFSVLLSGSMAFRESWNELSITWNISIRCCATSQFWTLQSILFPHRPLTMRSTASSTSQLLEGACLSRSMVTQIAEAPGPLLLTILKCDLMRQGMR
eukprot:TsM_000346200 transcript=TsM_000346200 gene=TsM_000346200